MRERSLAWILESQYLNAARWRQSRWGSSTTSSTYVVGAESPLTLPRALKINRANGYENSSLITRPPLAIFMGRPLRLVKVVESGIPSVFSTEAITSCEL